MGSMTNILERMKAVEEGDEILWNGRKVAQPVTKVSQTSFEAEGNRGGRYRFFTTGTDAPYLTNLNSNNDYSVDEFRIVGRSVEETEGSSAALMKEWIPRLEVDDTVVCHLDRDGVPVSYEITVHRIENGVVHAEGKNGGQYRLYVTGPKDSHPDPQFFYADEKRDYLQPEGEIVGFEIGKTNE